MLSFTLGQIIKSWYNTSNNKILTFQTKQFLIYFNLLRLLTYKKEKI